MENRVVGVLKRVFEIDDLDATCSQDNCEKWDSLNHLNVVLELEDEFEMEFEPEEIAEMKSVAGIVTILKAKKVSHS